MNSKVGRVKEYDGFCGIIECDNEEYILLEHDFISNEELKVNDIVTFIPDSVDILGTEKKYGRFITLKKSVIMDNKDKTSKNIGK